jgi:hypothetical protein
VPFCHYELAPAPEAALANGLRYQFTPGQSWVLGSLFLVRCADEAVYAVARDGRLTTYTRDGGKQTRPLEGVEDYEWVAREVLQLPNLPVREALAIQTALIRESGRT